MEVKHRLDFLFFFGFIQQKNYVEGIVVCGGGHRRHPSSCLKQLLCVRLTGSHDGSYEDRKFTLKPVKIASECLLLFLVDPQVFKCLFFLDEATKRRRRRQSQRQELSVRSMARLQPSGEFSSSGGIPKSHNGCEDETLLTLQN